MSDGKPQSGPHGNLAPSMRERDLLDILKLAEVSSASATGVEPPPGNGEKGELAGLGVLTGFWFSDVDPEWLECDGKRVVRQRYHPVMVYDEDCAFVIDRAEGD